MTFMGSWRAIAHVVETLFDAILPPSERSARMRTRMALPIAPLSRAAGRIGIVTLMDYRSREIADAICALKYDGNARAAKLLAAALADFLREEIHAARAFSPRSVVLVPVPLHPARKAERGFNQIERVLRELPPEFRDGTLARTAPAALARTRATMAQTRLPRRERLANVRGAFSANAALVRGTHVYVVDDVSTTGATLCACADALERAGAAVTAISLARA